MPFRHHKHCLPLLLLFILLSSHSAHPITVRRQLKDAKSILTSPNFAGTRSFFDVLRELLLPSSLSFSNYFEQRRGRVRRYTSKTRKAKSIATYRQSEGDGNFVIFTSSPGKRGTTLTNIVPQNDEPENQATGSNNDTPDPSIEAEPVTIEGTRSITPGSDLIINSNDNDNTAVLDVSGSNSNGESDLSPSPKADVSLNVPADPGSSQSNFSMPTGPQPSNEPSDDTSDVELNVIGPSIDELLDFELEAASPEGNGDSSISSDISADDVPQPSIAPGPQEDAGFTLVPPDTKVVFNTPEVDVDFPDISPDPSSTDSFDSSNVAEATPQFASAQPDKADDESSIEHGTESDLSKTEPSQAESSTEPSVLVDVPLSFSSSRGSLGPQFDKHSREFLGETTNTTADHWKPTEVSGTTSTIQRQQGSRWEITYQGELDESSAQQSAETLERNINEGAMDSYLTDRLSTPVTVRTASPPSLNAPPSKEVTVTGSVLKETASGNATTDAEEENEKSLGVILGTCFGLLGALVLGATAFAVVRRRSRNDEPHVLDGVATAPTTIMSFESDRTESESRFHTGAPTKPRGPNVLRNQSRILDWQMDHAAATGKARHILGRKNTESDIAEVISTSDEGNVSSAEVVV